MEYCLLINTEDEVFKPITDIVFGKKVWYQNRNGNWYNGVIVKGLEMVEMSLVPPPNNMRMAITVDYGDLVLLQNKEDLFEIIM